MVSFGRVRLSRVSWFVPVVPWIGSSISFSSFSRVSSGSSLLHPWGSLSFLPCSLFLSSPFAFLPPSSDSGMARVSVHGFSPSPGGSPALPRLGVSSLAWLLGCFLSCPLPFLVFMARSGLFLSECSGGRLGRSGVILGCFCVSFCSGFCCGLLVSSCGVPCSCGRLRFGVSVAVVRWFRLCLPGVSTSLVLANVIRPFAGGPASSFSCFEFWMWFFFFFFVPLSLRFSVCLSFV